MMELVFNYFFEATYSGLKLKSCIIQPYIHTVDSQLDSLFFIMFRVCDVAGVYSCITVLKLVDFDRAVSWVVLIREGLNSVLVALVLFLYWIFTFSYVPHNLTTIMSPVDVNILKLKIVFSGRKLQDHRTANNTTDWGLKRCWNGRNVNCSSTV